MPWPTNWGGYTPFDRIGGKAPGSELSADEALARFEQITGSVDERIIELGKLTRAHGFGLSTQPEDVKQLTGWLIASIEDDGYGQLRPYWDSVLYDVAMFVGDAPSNASRTCTGRSPPKAHVVPLHTFGKQLSGDSQTPRPPRRKTCSAMLAA